MPPNAHTRILSTQPKPLPRTASARSPDERNVHDLQQSAPVRSGDFIAAIVVLSLLFAGSADAHVYWANGGAATIGRANLDGTGCNQSFISGATTPRGRGRCRPRLLGQRRSAARSAAPTSTARASNQSFISGASTRAASRSTPARLLGGLHGGTIGRANLDGTGVDQSFIDGVDRARAASRSTPATSTGRTPARHDRPRQPRRHGRRPELHRRRRPDPAGVAVDARHIYWTNRPHRHDRPRQPRRHRRRPELHRRREPARAASRSTEPHLLGEQHADGTIGRANLDGTGVNQSFVSGASRPCGVAIDALEIGYPRPKGADADSRLPGPGYFLIAALRLEPHARRARSRFCTPPVQSSGFLTPSVHRMRNGAGANSIDSVVLKSCDRQSRDGHGRGGREDRGLDDRRAAFKAGLGDLHRAAAGKRPCFGSRIAPRDRLRTSPPPVQDFAFKFTVPCQTTASTTVAPLDLRRRPPAPTRSSPGRSASRPRTIWQLGDVELSSTGAATASPRMSQETRSSSSRGVRPADPDARSSHAISISAIVVLSLLFAGEAVDARTSTGPTAPPDDRARERRRHRRRTRASSAARANPGGVGSTAPHLLGEHRRRHRSGAPISTAPASNQSFITGAGSPVRGRGRRARTSTGPTPTRRDRSGAPISTAAASIRASSPARPRPAGSPSTAGTSTGPRTATGTIGRANLDGTRREPELHHRRDRALRASRSTEATSTGRTRLARRSGVPTSTAVG